MFFGVERVRCAYPIASIHGERSVTDLVYNAYVGCGAQQITKSRFFQGRQHATQQSTLANLVIIHKKSNFGAKRRMLLCSKTSGTV